MIKDLNELKKLLRICRAQGITEIKLGDVEIKFGDMPNESGSSVIELDEDVNPYANFPQGDLTPDQLMFYSAGGIPENDPVLKAKGIA